MQKEYILIKENVPPYFVPVICAHASLIAHLEWHAVPYYQYWLAHSFRKAVCSISEEDFEKVRFWPIAKRIVTESALGGKDVAIVLAPTKELPEEVRKFALWKPQ